jgi:hypothetical protein
VLRRILGGLMLLAFVVATAAPAAAAAASASPELCHCASHEHCPMATGPHTCASHDGTAVSRCDGSGALSVAALPAFVSPIAPTVPLAPASQPLAAPLLAPPAAIAAAPEIPPPKA